LRYTSQTADDIERLLSRRPLLAPRFFDRADQLEDVAVDVADERQAAPVTGRAGSRRARG